LRDLIDQNALWQNGAFIDDPVTVTGLLEAVSMNLVHRING
jgi:hypothetical protein